MPPNSLELSVAVPTFGRDKVLIDSIMQILEQSPRAAEILIVDQTAEHDPATKAQLEHWHRAGQIRWERLTQPSQPAALNHAIRIATQPLLLMLDDDIRIGPGFLAAHVAAFDNPAIWMVVGQVLQPDEDALEEYVHRTESGPLADLAFPFRSGKRAFIENGMSGNMSVRLEAAISLGGFDENFLPPVSYRFDTDFCKRLIRAGGKIRFEPSARINHLRAARGGTRTGGGHLTSASPIHGVGDYYFALRQGFSRATLAYVLRRPILEVRTRFHLRRPWWIPVKLFGEARAFLTAWQLLARGPKYLDSTLRVDPACGESRTGSSPA